MPSKKIQSPESVKVATESLAGSESWQIKLLYDGECPLCVREVNFLKKRDAGRGLVAFVDIADDNYTPDEHGGVDKTIRNSQFAIKKNNFSCGIQAH